MTELEEAIEIARIAGAKRAFRAHPGTGGVWAGRNEDIPDAMFRDWGLARAAVAILNAVIEGRLVPLTNPEAANLPTDPRKSGGDGRDRESGPSGLYHPEDDEVTQNQSQFEPVDYYRLAHAFGVSIEKVHEAIGFTGNLLPAAGIMTALSPDTSLLPCAFCGAGANIIRYITIYDSLLFGVKCSACPAEMRGFDQSAADAVEAWNTRAPAAPVTP